jgi:hypothetical protein
MPKHRALAVTRRLKSALIAGSVMAFGVLTALVASHATGVTARQSGNGAGSNSQTAPANSSSADGQGGFFNQAPSNSSGNAGSFGISPNAPSQRPSAGSSVS